MEERNEEERGNLLRRREERDKQMLGEMDGRWEVTEITWDESEGSA